MVSQMDDVDVQAILKPNMQDPVNAMERDIQLKLQGAEGMVENAMPKRLTSADEALDIQTSAATVLASKREARIQQKLMRKRAPHVRLGESQVESTDERQARDEQIESEVLHSIDPNLRIQDEKKEPVSGSSFRGMQHMIKAAMDSKMQDLGESLNPKDDIGEGIEQIVTNKKQYEGVSSEKRANVKAAVQQQLADINAKLSAAQEQLTPHNAVELLETQEDAGERNKKNKKKKAKVVIKDKTSGLISDGTQGYTPDTHATNPYASKPGDRKKIVESLRGNFSQKEIDLEVSAIQGHNLTAADAERAEVTKHQFKPVKPSDPGPAGAGPFTGDSELRESALAAPAPAGPVKGPAPAPAAEPPAPAPASELRESAPAPAPTPPEDGPPSPAPPPANDPPPGLWTWQYF